tara:strand:+ start:422 stop:607 length:186 start_codon:yes stop_codon:yes gene_type:complete
MSVVSSSTVSIGIPSPTDLPKEVMVSLGSDTPLPNFPKTERTASFLLSLTSNQVNKSIPGL